MIDLLYLHKFFLSAHIKPGDTVADFTMGNGNDTLWLSQTVGENGNVYSFDIQQAALDSTQKKLAENGASGNVTLIHDSHSNLKKYIPSGIKAGIFNLGYLPGSDKKITTMRETTAKALSDAISILENDGIILIAVYPGHHEGALEGETVREMLSEYSRYEYCSSEFKIVNSPTSPFFFMIERKPS